MARKGTTLLNIGTWTDSENPGAGSQDVDNTALNGNWIKIDTALGTEHNADGTHKAAKIDGTNLKTTVADGATIEQDTGTKKLKVKALGIAAAQIASDAVTTAKILDANVTHAKLAADAVDTDVIADDAITTVKILDGAVTVAKLATGLTAKRQIFGDQRVAGVSPGNAAAAVTTWTESSTSAVAKISVFANIAAGDKYVRLRGTLVSNSAKLAYVDLVAVGLTTASATFTKGSPYTTDESFTLDLDISSLSNSVEITVYLRAQSPATVSLYGITLEIAPA